MIHEWWGLNDNIEKMARVLASEGYIVFAVDMYNGSVANTSSRAGELSGNVRNNQAQYTQLLEDASESLDDHPRSTGRKASLGWCFGGGQSLQVALSGEDFDGTIIYYGSVTDNQTKLDMIDWPVLGIFGSEDRVIPLNDVRAFNESLNELGIENSIHIYEGAGHAFANPSGDSFRPNATRDAWNKTLTFLNEHLR
jgi:carboxymethylenebutenolidase